MRPHLVPRFREVLQWAPISRMIGIGVPIGFQFLLEFGIFGFAILMIGWISETAQAGHQIAINIASVTFMVPLGVSAAATVRVGQAIGRGDHANMRLAARTALVLGIGVMASFAIAMLLVPSVLATIYTPSGTTIAAAAALIPIAGVFQVFDGIQVVSLGILRGASDTRVPALINLFGYWAIGLPTAWLLARKTSLGAQGVWWGLTAGLASVALLLLVRVRRHLRKDLERVLIDR